MTKMQEEFKKASGNVIKLTPGEYEGPLVIDRPCVIDGNGSTVLCAAGPVISVKSVDVTLKNLRVEITDETTPEDLQIAIQSMDPATKLLNIEVRGRVVGIAGESEAWNLSPVVDLGYFAAEKSNSFLLTIDAPSAASLRLLVNGISVTPSALVAGKNHILLTTEPLRHQSRLYGELMVQTTVARRIYITGAAMKDAPLRSASLPAPPQPPPAPARQTPPQPRPAQPVPKPADPSVRLLQRGQRIFASEMKSPKLRFLFDFAKASPDIDVNCYCFALGENGKVAGDKDLIFFNNPASADQSIVTGYADKKPMVTVETGKASQAVTRIAVCFAIYGSHPTQNFSKIVSPSIRFFGGDKEYFRFEMTHLVMEKAVVALEIYRYKGEWKINPVGSGYTESLQQLCRSFGVNA